ncbi:MAG: ABC transporter substrate-binding protein [Solirubrobacterales bacterium]
MTLKQLKKIRLSALPALVLAAILLSACGGGGKSEGGGTDETSTGPVAKGGTLTLSQGQEVDTLNPQVGNTLNDINVMSQMFETLFQENTKGEVVPWLVETSKGSDHESVWTFDLRKGVKFSNGKPMTSADVLWTLEKAKSAPAGESVIAQITKIKAPSPSQIVLETENPSPELPVLLSQWTFAILPKNYGGVSEKEFDQQPIGTGPFALVEHKAGESITFEKNKYYWQTGKPYLSKLVFQTVTNPSSRAQQLQSGSLDAVFAPPWPQVESIENSSELEFAEFPLGYIKQLQLNAKSALFSNDKAREAMDLGIDRKSLIEVVTAGHGEPAASLIPPAIPGHDPSIQPPEVDLQKAKEVLAEAVKEGVDPTFTLLCITEDDFWTQAAQILQQELAKVGFTVKIQKLDESSWFELLEAGKYEAIAGYATSAVPTPAEAFGFYIGVHGYFTNAPTAQIEKLLTEAQKETNAKKRADLYNQMQAIVAEENYVMPVIYTPYPWALSTKVKGFYVGDIGTPYLYETSVE